MNTDLLLDPMGPAWRRMMLTLFHPFRFSTYLRLTFCGWLGYVLSRQWAEVFQVLNYMNLGLDKVGGDPQAFLRQFETRLAPVMGLILLLMAVGFVLMILFNVVGCFGRFIFLEQVVRNDVPLGQSWSRNTGRAFGLFGLTVLLNIMLGLVVTAVGFVVVLTVIPSVQSSTFHPVTGLGILFALIALVVISIGTFYVTTFVDDLVIPIMWRFNLGVFGAVRHVCQLTWLNLGLFLTYGLWRFALASLVQIAFFGICILALVVTCCMIGLLKYVPFLTGFLQALVLLPAWVFFRVYSLEFLAQFGPEYNLFPPEEDDEPPPEPDDAPPPPPEEPPPEESYWRPLPEPPPAELPPAEPPPPEPESTAPPEPPPEPPPPPEFPEPPPEPPAPPPPPDPDDPPPWEKRDS